MQALFTAVTRFFNMWTILFVAGEGAARTVGNIVKIGENMSEVALLKNQLTDQAEIEEMRAKLAARAKLVGSSSTTAAAAPTADAAASI